MEVRGTVESREQAEACIRAVGGILKGTYTCTDHIYAQPSTINLNAEYLRLRAYATPTAKMKQYVVSHKYVRWDGAMKQEHIIFLQDLMRVNKHWSALPTSTEKRCRRSCATAEKGCGIRKGGRAFLLKLLRAYRPWWKLKQRMRARSSAGEPTSTLR